jgi:hypothetical protein
MDGFPSLDLQWRLPTNTDRPVNNNRSRFMRMRSLLVVVALLVCASAQAQL